MSRACGTWREKGNTAYRILIGKPASKREREEGTVDVEPAVMRM
jgi:hypothetical protein